MPSATTWFSRRGPRWCVGSMRSPSIQNLPAPYPASQAPSATPRRDGRPAQQQPADQDREAEVPRRLEGERRLEVRVREQPGRAVLEVDREPPPAVRRLAVELLVEPVPEPPDRLPEREPGRREVEHAQRIEPAQARADRQHERAADRGAEDAEPPAPHVERALVRRSRAAGDEVVEPGPGERDGHGGEAEPEDVEAATDPPLGDQRRHHAEDDDPERDEQAVPVAAERPDPEHGRPGTRHELPGPPQRPFDKVRNGQWGIV